ncbi:MAG: TauD/TfdA family dioxygenase [Gallionellaceae bacterium]
MGSINSRPENSPYDLNNQAGYLAWREWKLANAPPSADELVVQVEHPGHLSPAEHEALLARCRTCNMVIYQSSEREADKEIVHRVGRQFRLENQDANWLAGEDGVSEIAVSAGEPRQSYIPYTNRPIKWHTDGYYNPFDRRIRAMLLHCVSNAAQGGENRLMDHEIAYLLLRDENPDFIRALIASDAMTIPERTDEDGVARAAQTGPVFSMDAMGNLHMRYTARTRSIEWKQNETTLAAVACLEKILSSDSPYIYRTMLKPGMGLLCNNVLHDRSEFIDADEHRRLLYRARYFDRIEGTSLRPA